MTNITIPPLLEGKGFTLKNGEWYFWTFLFWSPVKDVIKLKDMGLEQKLKYDDLCNVAIVVWDKETNERFNSLNADKHASYPRAQSAASQWRDMKGK